MKKDVEEAEAGHRARQAGGHGDQEVSRVGQTDLDVLGKIVAQNGEVSHLAFPGGEVVMSIQNPWAFARGLSLTTFFSRLQFLVSEAPALPCGSFEEKQPIVIKDEPRMNTNSHECRWTHSNEKRHHNASATLLPWYDFVSFVDNPSISIVTPPNPQLINPFIGVHSCPFVVRRFPLE